MKHRLIVRLTFPLMTLFVRVLFYVLGPIRSHDRNNVPRNGGLLILANHIADVDPPVVQLACPRMIHFMAKSELFEIPVLKHFIKWFHAFPVKRGEPDRAAIKHAIALASSGEAVCLFPEGQLSETGALQPLLPGAALIVRKAEVPVVCCGISGTDRVMPYKSVVPRPALRCVHVRWGHAQRFDPDATNEDIIEWATNELKRLTATR